jgi:hypothetical protein
MEDRFLLMTAVAALLERPLWELAIGASSVAAVSIMAALAFFWIGFRIAEVPASVGFEAMFGLSDGEPQGNARVVPREVASRLKAIQDRATVSAHRASLGELAIATDRGRTASERSVSKADAARTAFRDQ